MDKIIIYEVELATYTRSRRRNDTYTSNAKYDRILYTSKNKAIDRLRSLATLVHDYSVKAYFKAYEEGRAKNYVDNVLSISEYHESEGKLNFEDTHYFMETSQGGVFKYEDKDIFFQSI